MKYGNFCEESKWKMRKTPLVKYRNMENGCIEMVYCILFRTKIPNLTTQNS